MTISLEKLNARLSDKRRALAEKTEERESLYERIDSAMDQIEQLESAEELTADQAQELKDLAEQYKSDEKAARKLTTEARDLASEIDDLESQRRDRQEAFSTPESPQNRQAPGDSGNPAPSASDNSQPRVLPATNEQMDHDIASFMRNSFIARSNGSNLRAVCAGEFGDNFRNDRLGANITTTSGGAAILPPNYRPRLIELLRPRVVMRAMQGVREIPLLNGNLTIPRQSGAASANYTAEMSYIVDSEPATDSIALSAKKLTALVVQSGELMRRSDPASDRMILDDLIDVLARKEDLTFLRSDGSGNSPKGLKKYIDDADTALGAGTRAIAANTTVNLQNVTEDIGKLILALAAQDVPMRNPYFIMHPRTQRFLMDFRDGNGNMAFPEVKDGMLRAYPYLTTTQIPTNLDVTTSGNDDESELYFVDASEFIIGDAPTFEVNVSMEAAYHDGSNVRAAFSEDSVVFRTIVEHDTQIRHSVSAAYLTGVDWGGVANA